MDRAVIYYHISLYSWSVLITIKLCTLLVILLCDNMIVSCHVLIILHVIVVHVNLFLSLQSVFCLIYEKDWKQCLKYILLWYRYVLCIDTFIVICAYQNFSNVQTITDSLKIVIDSDNLSNLTCFSYQFLVIIWANCSDL